MQSSLFYILCICLLVSTVSSYQTTPSSSNDKLESGFMSGLTTITRFKLLDCIYDSGIVLKDALKVLKQLLMLQFTGAMLEVVDSVRDLAEMLNDCGINFNAKKMEKVAK